MNLITRPNTKQSSTETSKSSRVKDRGVKEFRACVKKTETKKKKKVKEVIRVYTEAEIEEFKISNKYKTISDSVRKFKPGRFNLSIKLPKILVDFIRNFIDIDDAMYQQDEWSKYYVLMFIMLARYNPELKRGWYHSQSICSSLIREYITFLTHFRKEEKAVTEVSCERYSIDPLIYDMFVELMMNLKPEELKEVAGCQNLNNKNKEDENWLLLENESNRIPVNVEKLKSDSLGKYYYIDWITRGVLVDGIFTQKLYVRKNDPNVRAYELGSYGYQTMPSYLKELIRLKGQMNIDMIGAHISISKELSEKFAEFENDETIIKHRAALKLTGTELLYGQNRELSIKLLENRMPEASQEERVRIVDWFLEHRKALLKELGIKGYDFWRFLQKEERKIMKIVESHLETKGITYLNMHDGLLLSEHIDLNEINALFPNSYIKFAEKPLWGGEEEDRVKRVQKEKDEVTRAEYYEEQRRELEIPTRLTTKVFSDTPHDDDYLMSIA